MDFKIFEHRNKATTIFRPCNSAASDLFEDTFGLVHGRLPAHPRQTMSSVRPHLLLACWAHPLSQASRTGR
jgi:hypothetical protein